MFGFIALDLLKNFALKLYAPWATQDDIMFPLQQLNMITS